MALLSNDERLLVNADPFIRWAIVDLLQSIGERRFAWFTCVDAKRAAMGDGVAAGKQNNLRCNKLSGDCWSTWGEFVARVIAFAEGV